VDWVRSRSLLEPSPNWELHEEMVVIVDMDKYSTSLTVASKHTLISFKSTLKTYHKALRWSYILGLQRH